MANMMSADNVVSGEIHSCSLADGHAYCWGNNTYGQLGVAGTQVGELNAQEVLTNIANLTPLDQVSVIASGGGKHTCALRAGKVLCWGANGSGQLGADPAALVQRPNAVEVAGIADATAIGAADGITCAVRAGGTVWCWGSADTGQIGDAGAIFDGGLVSFNPVQIKGAGGVGDLTDVVAVAPGRRHVCARKVDNTVWCWGKNDRGQLGDGSMVDSIHPVKVTGLP
jgi:alpha-tubulin suppressor-like RCC1 family protein